MSTRVEKNELTRLQKYKPYPAYKDSGVEWLGEIPALWEVNRIKWVCMIKYGLGEPPQYQKHGLPFIRATDINSGKINMDSVKFVNSDEVSWSRDPSLRFGDIIVVRSGGLHW